MVSSDEKSTDSSKDQTEKEKLRSFASLLHMILVKVIRDGEERISGYVLGADKDHDWQIVVRKVPKDTWFMVDEEDVQRGLTHPPDLQVIK